MSNKKHPLLNEEQKKAVAKVYGPLLVIAGAGSGKTRVVTHRIAHLIESGIPPEQILAVTFTNKAAEEMKERVRNLCHHTVWISTFHRLGAKILRESIHHLGYTPYFTIYDEEDSLKLMRSVLQELNVHSSTLDPKTARQLISNAKNDLQLPEEMDTDLSKNPIGLELKEVYERYQNKLKTANALDFDDLLYLVILLFKTFPEVLSSYQGRWPFILVDEYQDTNHAQSSIIDLLVQKSKNICVVGDPDQSIYSWRGANISNILRFSEDYPETEVIRLEQNYRSTENILEASNALIQHNQSRLEKNLWSAKGPGEKISLYVADNEQREAEYVVKKILEFKENENFSFHDVAVFYRTNAQSRVFEDVFLRNNIPYVIIGGISFYQRKEIKDILAFLRMILSDSDEIAFLRTIHLPKRGLGDTTLEKIKTASLLENIPLFSFCQNLISSSSSLKLTKKQKDGLKEYIDVINLLRHLAKDTSIKETVKAAIEQTGYLQILEEDKISYEDRKENLDALVAKAFQWELENKEGNLQSFLEELSLKADIDEKTGDETKVHLMTLHNGKGLEFLVVFLVGMEEFLLPHANSQRKENAIEEERRLCYVGMTRAKEHLTLSYARSRFLWGVVREQIPSRFLQEIPEKNLEKVKTFHPSFFERKKPSFSPTLSFRFKTSSKTQAVETSTEFVIGDKIFHKEFGIGVVEDISKSSIGTICQIRFIKDKTTKKIVATKGLLTKL